MTAAGRDEGEGNGTVFRRHQATSLSDRARAQTGDLEIHCACEHGRYVVAPAGEIDLASAWRLEQELMRAEDSGAGEILLDLGGVQFIDSVGMQPVIHASARMRLQGRTLLIAPGPANVQRCFEISGLTSRLPFVDRDVIAQRP